MKNYINEAREQNITIYNGSKYLQSYHINRENNFVSLKYMNGYRENVELKETSKEELDKRQRDDLRELEKEVKKKTSFELKYNGIASGTYIVLGTLLRTLGNSRSFVWLVWSGYFLSKAVRPLRLRKDIQLAGWIYDNKDKVNEVIQDEVYEKAPNLRITATTNNAPLAAYPYEKVPYPKEMFDNGIDLNNIDYLNNKQLRSLKRKVLRKERRKKYD